MLKSSQTFQNVYPSVPKPHPEPNPTYPIKSVIIQENLSYKPQPPPSLNPIPLLNSSQKAPTEPNLQNSIVSAPQDILLINRMSFASWEIFNLKSLSALFLFPGTVGRMIIFEDLLHISAALRSLWRWGLLEDQDWCARILWRPLLWMCCCRVLPRLYNWLYLLACIGVPCCRCRALRVQRLGLLLWWLYRIGNPKWWSVGKYVWWYVWVVLEMYVYVG